MLLAVDASKLGRAAPVQIGGMADVDYLITDSDDARLASACAAAGTRMIRPD
ncbi:hypothetical protein AB5I41_28295 [Sphingomonas sp. MMS24-JH45]